jgi:hypothetical protein
MARLQDHEGRPATTLDWTTLRMELICATRDFSEFGENRDADRMREIDAEITNRVMRAELAYPGCMKLLEGDAL